LFAPFTKSYSNFPANSIWIWLYDP